MFEIKNIRIQDILISKHALERAKNRMILKIDKNSLEFEIRIKELIKTSIIREVDKHNNLILEFVYDNKVYRVIAQYQVNNKILIKTMMEK